MLRVPFPEEQGLAGSILDMAIIAEELSRKSFDLFTAYGGSVFCGFNVLRKGTEEQHRHWIPKLLVGEIKMSVSILGSYGYNMEFDMQRHFRDARSVTIGAGTSQMQRNLIANLMGLKVQ